MAEEGRRSLYPPIEPYNTGTLVVSDIHTLYYEECGNPEGKPVVVLHGGPGGGIVPSYRCYFDPKKYRIVLFDQRGAGKSTPLACLVDNTTWTLVEDVEKIRNHLGISKWVVFGGSWGSTLSLAYAETYPASVKALVLRGIFTLRRKELLWFYQDGASFIFPDAWDGFIKPIPEAERGDLMSAYYRYLTGDDEEKKMECARAWSTWEMATSKLFVSEDNLRKAENDDFAISFARIESHYFVHGGFFKEDGELLKSAILLKDIPGTIVQGRYDVVCPATTAWELHKILPHFDFSIVADAGHSCSELGTIDLLVRATDKYSEL
mmetsp:Transcript_70101/g.106003  ORF Transcript_70101/g.106003 Transcript_70101/m.106003 type:complete len:321 (-) Transcript_70101:48-1010(-)|eukprot:CAMPEP_0117014502 /NCGR_PEP_ID=MMETSP0472-20121206/11753_1 /TAXON_ID=693140 ORGANISM="Tiarina fusus, Strain LIS" /NCGR_SAMPLE_ID=MMETSP0472 /ASSEMBLY_ACC=CAM_ASM_000603 /LENGTH=320 /DNA_ID=CAMNT_0004718077 /DNA_START=20 /DNA_END=982 /DNA_ORIENTATION=+